MKYTKFDLHQLVLSLDGTPAQRTKVGGGTENFTVLDAVRVALNNVFFDEQPSQAKPAGDLTPETKVLRFEIMKKLFYNNEEVVLENKEVTELLKCVSKTYPIPEVFGFLQAVIEGKPTGIIPAEIPPAPPLQEFYSTAVR